MFSNEQPQYHGPYDDLEKDLNDSVRIMGKVHANTNEWELKTDKKIMLRKNWAINRQKKVDNCYCRTYEDKFLMFLWIMSKLIITWWHFLFSLPAKRCNNILFSQKISMISRFHCPSLYKLHVVPPFIHLFPPFRMLCLCIRAELIPLKLLFVREIPPTGQFK